MIRMAKRRKHRKRFEDGLPLPTTTIIARYPTLIPALGADGYIFIPTMNRATMNRATMNRATMNRATMNRATMNRATMNRATMNRATMNRATMNRATMNRATMNRATMNRATMNRQELMALDPLKIPFYSSQHTGRSHIPGNKFNLGKLNRLGG